MDAEEQFLSGACIYKIFPKLISQRYGRGSKSHNRTEEELDSLLGILKNYYCSDNIHQCRTVFGSMNQNVVKRKFSKEKIYFLQHLHK